MRSTAAEYDLSGRLRQIYATWIIGFIRWCLNTPPRSIRLDRIGAFIEAMDRQRKVSSTDRAQAMDALAFLFGAVLPRLRTEQGLRSIIDLDSGLVEWAAHEEAEQASSQAYAYYNRPNAATVRLSWSGDGARVSPGDPDTSVTHLRVNQIHEEPARRNGHDPEEADQVQWAAPRRPEHRTFWDYTD